MKSAFLLVYALGLSLGAAFDESPAALSAAPKTSESAIPIGVEEQFFVDNPDLKDEREVVEGASRALASEGYKSTSVTEISATLAARSREIIAQRSQEEWQKKAIRLFPALGVAGSEFNALFVKHYREMKASGSSFETEPSWPVLLAKRCDDELRATQPALPQGVPQAPASQPEGAKPAHRAPIQSAPQQARHPFKTAISILLLALLAGAPGVYAFRKASAYFAPKPGVAESRRDFSLWGIALKHAAVLYVIVAFAAGFRTLLADADLAFLDRLAVSAAVGGLFGVFVSLPMFVLDALWQSVRRHGGGGGTLAHR